MDTIPKPISGMPVINWADTVTNRLNALPSKIGASSINERNRTGHDFIHPYKVRYNKKEDKFLIYLANGDNVFYWNGNPVTISGVSWAGYKHGLGWYFIQDSSKDSDGFYLVVVVNKKTQDIEKVAIQPYADTSETGKTVFNILLVWNPGKGKNELMFVTSAIMLGSEVKGGDATDDNDEPDYEPEEEKTIVTDVSWDSSYCKLVIKRAKITLKGGMISAWEDAEDTNIDTISNSEVGGS